MQEFKNENLNVKVEKSPGCQVKLEIYVSPKATEAARAKAIKNVNKEIVIPGFRKGKAPVELVLQKFKNPVDEEWKNILLNTAFQEVLDLTHIYPLSQKTVRPEIKSMSLDEGSKLIINYESQPEIPEIDSSKITLKNVPVKAVTEEDIEDRFNELQLHQAKWEEVTERGIQEGDFVHLDIESLDQPGLVVCKNQPFSVVKGKIGNWLYQLLLDKHVKDTFEGMSEKEACSHECNDPTHVHPKNEEFKPSKLKITVQAVKKPQLPEIDTAFATKLGTESVEQLRERVITSLENNFKDDAKAALREQMKDAIINQYPFEIPSSLINAYGQKLDEQAKLKLAEDYRLYFIVEKLASQLQLQITQDEIVQEYTVQAYLTKPEHSYIDPSLDPKEISHRIRSRLLEQKVSDYLVEKANKE
jgi:trigger factor